MPTTDPLAAPAWAGLLLAAFAARFLWLRAGRVRYRQAMRGRIWQYWTVGSTVLFVYMVVAFSRTIDLSASEARAWSVAIGTCALPVLLTGLFAVWWRLRRPSGERRIVAQVFFHGAYAYPLLILLAETLGSAR